MEYRVLVTPAFLGRKNLAPIHLLSEAGCEVVPSPYMRTATEDEMCALVADVDAAIVSLDPVTEKALASGPRLKIVARRGVGCDNIDVAAATRMGILVTNVPGANSRAVAELAVGLGMRVLCYSRTHDRIWADAIGAAYVSLDELLRTSDAVSLHIALTDDTRKLISERELSLMKPLLVLENVVLTPHTSGLTSESAHAMAMGAARNVVAVLHGRTPENAVNAPRASG